MTIPDDIKREAEEIVKRAWPAGMMAHLAGKADPDSYVVDVLAQALLSSRDQGYQEGVEDAVKAVEEAKVKCSSQNFQRIGTPDFEHISKAEIISSLKDKLKPKEKDV